MSGAPTPKASTQRRTPDSSPRLSPNSARNAKRESADARKNSARDKSELKQTSCASPCMKAEPDETRSPVAQADRNLSPITPKPPPTTPKSSASDLKDTSMEDDVDKVDNSPSSSRQMSPKNPADKVPVRLCFHFNRLGGRPEEAELDEDAEYAAITFSKTQIVYEVESERVRTHLKIIRSRADPWRRYGALQMIHKVGGYVTQGLRRTGKAPSYVKAGTTCPPPPKEQPIWTLEDLLSRPISKPTAALRVHPKKPNPLEDTSPDALSTALNQSDSPKRANNKSAKGNDSSK